MSPVKTKDLCERCKYHFRRWCDAKQGCSCIECEHFSKDNECLCLTVKANTPCPYFKEADDDET